MSKRIVRVRVGRSYPPDAVLAAARKVATWLAGDIARALGRRRDGAGHFYSYRRPAELLDALTALIEHADDRVRVPRPAGRRRRKEPPQ